MRHHLSRLIALLLISSSPAFGQTPDAPYYVSFQGFLEDDGSPASGTYSIQFRFMNQSAGGSSVWTETHPSVQVTDGLYSVLLGSITTMANEDFDDDLWMSVLVNGGAEILPRARIVGTPYSFLSFEALTLRIPSHIIGTTNVDGNEMIKITQQGTGDILEINGSGVASNGITVSNVDLTAIVASSNDYAGVSGSGKTAGVTGSSSTGDALVASSAGDDGLYVVNAGDDGIYVANAGDDGIYVANAGDAGILVDGVGGYAFDFRDVPIQSGGGNLTAYVGRIENTSTGTSSDALAIQIETPGNPGTAANFVGFFDGDNDLIGQIEGNGSGGVAYNTTGADYAEYLPHLSTHETFSAGDVVGVFDGHISRNTSGAQQVMAITDRAAVLGNAPSGLDEADGYESVGFIGQVLVRVRGPVTTGDYIVASGQNDGIGVAVPPADITVEHMSSLVGRAWESSSDLGVRRINIVVGLDRSEAVVPVLLRALGEMNARLQSLENRLGTQ